MGLDVTAHACLDPVGLGWTGLVSWRACGWMMGPSVRGVWLDPSGSVCGWVHGGEILHAVHVIRGCMAGGDGLWCRAPFGRGVTISCVG